MVEIQTDILLGVLITILAASFGVQFKNNRCIAHIEERLTALEKWADGFVLKQENTSSEVNKLKSDMAVLYDRDPMHYPKKR